MIKRIDLTGYNGTGYQVIQDKINEIIDHLPQEKEDFYCEHSAINAFVSTCEKCQLRKLSQVRPTKEVPDIRGILSDILAEFGNAVHNCDTSPAIDVNINNFHKHYLDKIMEIFNAR